MGVHPPRSTGLRPPASTKRACCICSSEAECASHEHSQTAVASSAGRQCAGFLCYNEQYVRHGCHLPCGHTSWLLLTHTHSVLQSTVHIIKLYLYYYLGPEIGDRQGSLGRKFPRLRQMRCAHHQPGGPLVCAPCTYRGDSWAQNNTSLAPEQRDKFQTYVQNPQEQAWGTSSKMLATYSGYC